MSKKENEELFNLTDLIRFGYFARKNPNIPMRQAYFKWKELPSSKTEFT